MIQHMHRVHKFMHRIVFTSCLTNAYLHDTYLFRCIHLVHQCIHMYTSIIYAVFSSENMYTSLLVLKFPVKHLETLMHRYAYFYNYLLPLPPLHIHLVTQCNYLNVHVELSISQLSQFSGYRTWFRFIRIAQKISLCLSVCMSVCVAQV